MENLVDIRIPFGLERDLEAFSQLPKSDCQRIQSSISGMILTQHGVGAEIRRRLCEKACTD